MWKRTFSCVFIDSLYNESSLKWGKTMNYRFELNVEKKEFNHFVENHEYCNLLQSYQWANVKQNWDHYHTGVYENGTLVATGLVLIKVLPMNFTMFYIPRGPIMDYKNEELLQFYFKELKKVAKKRHCLFIKFDPAILKSKSHLKEEKKDFDLDLILVNLKKCGAVHKGFTENMSDTIQPRFNMTEYKEDFNMDNFSKKGKKNIKIAKNQEVEIRIGNLELLDDFEKVMKLTEERKGISLRSKNYYKLLLDTYKENAFITLSYLSIQKSLKNTENKYEKCLMDLKNCPENSKKKKFTLEELKISLERKINEYSISLKKYGETVCICGTLTIVYGKTSEILYAGMNDEFKRLMGPYFTWYKTMERCFDLGCETSNMGGIEGSLKGGLVDFKEIYYPCINEFIGEFDLPVNKLLFKISLKAYEKMKKRIKS